MGGRGPHGGSRKVRAPQGRTQGKSLVQQCRDSATETIPGPVSGSRVKSRQTPSGARPNRKSSSLGGWGVARPSCSSGWSLEVSGNGHPRWMAVTVLTVQDPAYSPTGSTV